MHQESTSTTLLARIQARDEDAWQQVVQLYGRLVLFWLRRFDLHEADREDVFQEIFKSASLRIGTFRRDQPSYGFRRWLRKITENELKQYYRKAAGKCRAAGGSAAFEQLQNISISEASSTDASLCDEEIILLREALRIVKNDFQSHTWEAFWRSTADGVPTAVVADELNMTRAAVRKAKSRVLQRLREVLPDLDGSPW